MTGTIYTLLTQEERYQFHALMKAGHTQTQTTRALERHMSTIYRVTRHNRGLRSHRPMQAHCMSDKGRLDKARARFSAVRWDTVERLLHKDWWPKQICLWLVSVNGFWISHEFMYQFVLQHIFMGSDLHCHLRCEKLRPKRYGCYSRRGLLNNRVSIDQRSAIEVSRLRLGDWELDTIICKGHKQAIVSLTERIPRLIFIHKVERRTTDDITHAIPRLLIPLAHRVRTLTSDYGKGFADHELIAKDLAAQFFFAHSYSSWERGLYENTNGLIRQCFPKRRDFTTITQEVIKQVMDKLNNRLRKCLGIKTPNQGFIVTNPPVALAS